MPTDEEWNKLLKILKRYMKKTDQSIADIWEHVNSVQDNEVNLVDDAIEKVERAQRAVKRLEKRVEELEGE